MARVLRRALSQVTASNLRSGDVVSLEERLLRVRSAKAVKPGKGVAYVQCELACIREGINFTRRLRSAENIKRIRLDDAERYTALYENPDTGRLVVMHNESFEQMEIGEELFGEALKPFLAVEGIELNISMYNGEPLSATLPTEVTLQVMSEEQMSGGTGSPVTKVVKLSNGLELKVPGFIGIGDSIAVDTRSVSYARRV